jgi:hypothetical protein
MIRNSIAIQTGADPSTAAITFHWGEERPNGDRAFFPNRGSEWFWPGDGIRLGDRLILFLMRIHETRGGTGFESSGWNAVMVSNPDADPSRWDMKWIDQQENATGVVIGSASVIRWGEYLYAYGAQETVKSHPIHLVRWPVERAGKGDLRSPQWWAGADIGWAGDSSSIPRWPAFENGATELTVHYDTLSRNFLAFHTVGFGAADIAIRSSPLPGGPWSGPRMIYRPSEYYRPDIMIYSAKAHPQLRGADLVLTYSTNSFRFSEQLSDSLIYYPRFVRLARCR